MTIGLVLALASTTLISLAYLREHEAVSRMSSLSLRHPGRSVRLLVADRAWLTGFGMETGGFALYVTALALAPLALVQSVAAGGVGILAVAGAHLAHRRMTRARADGSVRRRRGACAVGDLADRQ
ncbi:MAG TPA: hypothetical protein VE127_01860 [Solirubrobacteraceae bacterium]|jgi:hypothetical protein|nr:hypothetical protein [Solirubrobacteraceae bacterium]